MEEPWPEIWKDLKRISNQPFHHPENRLQVEEIHHKRVRFWLFVLTRRRIRLRTPTSNTIRPNQSKWSSSRWLKLWSVCECESVGGVKHQRSTIQRSVTEANQRAASLGRGAVLRCSTPLQIEEGSTQRRQDVTLSRQVHPPEHTKRLLEWHPLDGWVEATGPPDLRTWWTSQLLSRMEVEVSGTLQHDNETSTSSKSTKNSDLGSPGMAKA